MFDNTNPYTIRFEETDGRKCYFVAFTDGQGNFREIEVSKAVYMEFCHFIKRERNLRRSDERHLEQSELTEETLCRRAVHKPKPIDEAVNDTIRLERLNRAIMQLPEIQRRRFMLHFDLGLTYEQIGAMEGCTKMAAITSRVHTKAKLPTHTAVNDFEGLDKDSIILLEQIRTIDKQRLKQYMGLMSDNIMARVDKALAISISLNNRPNGKCAN